MSGSRGLPDALERAARALPGHADDIRPANGDPGRLHQLLSGEARAAVLRWLLEHETTAGAELAAAWAEDMELSPEALLAVEPEGLPKEARKALRRAHHRLRSRGVDVPEATTRAGVVAKLPPIEDELRLALVSAIDPRGTRVVHFVEPHPSGGARLFEVLIGPERGIVECEVYAAPRRNVRQFVRAFTRRDRFPASEVPPDAARALVARAASRQPSDRPLPRAFSEWRARIAVAPDGTPTPGEIARDELARSEPGVEPAAERVARVLELVRSYEVGPWPPAGDALRPLAEKLGGILEGRIVVSGPTRWQQIAEALDEGTAHVYAEPFGGYTAERFEEMAYVLWRTKREEDARACLAAAELFRGRPGVENPVARALLEVLLAPVLDKLREETQPEDEGPGEDPSSLIVKP